VQVQEPSRIAGPARGLPKSNGMKTLMRVAVVTLLAVASSIAVAAAGPATDQLQADVGRMFRTLADTGQGGADADQRRSAIFAIAAEAFDFEHAARLTLGTHWDALSPAQRAEFVQLFRAFVERSYLSNVQLSGSEQVVYGGEAVEGDRAVVRATVLSGQGSGTAVDFRMLHGAGDRWRLYDVNFEGMSLVANYRAQFTRLLRAGSYDELVQKLRAKQQ
jgi:phospholipid transport system substrate-binding protein